MNKDNYIRIWHLNEKGKSIPINHNKLIIEFSGISPNLNAQEIINILLSEDLISIDIYGNYILTDSGIKIRKRYPNLGNIIEEKVETLPAQRWKNFRNLLSYYIDCVHIQERSQDYLYDNQEYRNFFVPIMPYGWLKSIEEDCSDVVSINLNSKTIPVANLLYSKADEDEEIYIGYPLLGIKNKDKKGYSYTPIALIPLDIKDCSHSSMKFVLRLKDAEINQAWLDYNIDDDDKVVVFNALYNFSTNNKYKGLLDLKKALPWLANYSNYEKDEFYPDDCLKILPKDFTKVKYIDAPVIFKGTSLKYSKTLKKELIYIRDEVSDEILDDTSLAYVFRNPLKKFSPQEDEYIPLSFINSNEEQRLAVSKALNKPISKVTGPPGTGKSQVAVNIIANLIYNNKTVLFTSMNHKAVNAIADRSGSLLEDYHMDSVKFCSNEDNSIQNPWYKQNIENLINNARAVHSQLKSSSVDYISDATRNIQRLYKRLSVFEEPLKLSSNYSETYTRLATNLQRILKNSGLGENIDLKALIKHSENLKDDVTLGYSISKIIKYYIWLFIHKKQSLEAKHFIFEQFPFFDKDSSIEDIKEDLDEIIEILKEFRENEKRLDYIKKKLAKLPDSSKYTETLAELLSSIDENLLEALAFKFSNKICQLGESPEELGTLNAVMNILKSATSPYFFQKIKKETYDDALTAFKLFSKYFPAWATTLLSLTKASPCIPSLFDTVIIDEASQCVIAPIIPALFRAKTLCVIGDPMQFPPVVTMKPSRHDYLKSKYGLTDLASQRYDFMAFSAYDIINEQPVMLKEHFRCNQEIAEFINDEFYANELRIRTDKSKLKFPSVLGYKNALEWANIVNSNELEIEEVITRLDRLIEIGYTGSVGVISPHKKNIKILDEKLTKAKSKLNIKINTANGFQGGECDVIIFMLGYNDSLSKGGRWYATSDDNRYIYNVAVSRARAYLLIVGDRNSCANSDIEVLRKLAQYPKEVEPKHKKENSFDSIIEEKFYYALKAASIETVPQYPVLGRRLDLAIVDAKNKIDIELDGKKYHLNSDGNRKIDDIYRDLQLESSGWKVIRFWASEINSDINKCVEKVQKIILR